MSDDIQWPTGFEMKDLVAYGNTGMVVLDRDTDTVIKTPHEASSEAIAIERQIYERLSRGTATRVFCVITGSSNPAFALSMPPSATIYIYIRSYLEDHPANEARKLRWATQISEALDFAHKCGVIHGDINAFNVLVDGRLDAKLSDFAGSSLDGTPLLVGVTASHLYPGPRTVSRGGHLRARFHDP